MKDNVKSMLEHLINNTHKIINHKELYSKLVEHENIPNVEKDELYKIEEIKETANE